MKKVCLFLSCLMCVFIASYSYACGAYDDNGAAPYADGQQFSEGQMPQYDGGNVATTSNYEPQPAEHPAGDCYCLYCRYEPCYYNKWHCCYVPKYTYKKCCRYCPQYYQKQCCRYVPQYYCQTCCRYCPQYYYTCHCQQCPKYSCEKCCRWVPKYYYKRSCAPACCPQQSACGPQGCPQG